MPQYLRFRNGKFLVKNEIGAFLLFYRYLLFRPRLANRPLRKIVSSFDMLVEFFARVFFFFKLNRLLQTQHHENNFEILRAGGGLLGSSCTIVKTKGGHTITKQFTDPTAIEAEKKYLELYSGKSHALLFPSYKITSQEITYEFLRHRSLKSLIRRGTVSRSEALEIYLNIFYLLSPLYEKAEHYQHGDLATENIYPYCDKIYLIDYADSAYLPAHYDIIFLLFRIVSEYQKMSLPEFLSNLNPLFMELGLNLNVSKSERDTFRVVYQSNLKKKYGSYKD